MGHRGASVRISNQVMKDKSGYFEDRRPASNCDPYLVTGLLLETINKSESDMDTDINEALGKTNVIV
jgi:glutamine synthetase